MATGTPRPTPVATMESLHKELGFGNNSMRFFHVMFASGGILHEPYKLLFHQVFGFKYIASQDPKHRLHPSSDTVHSWKRVTLKQVRDAITQDNGTKVRRYHHTRRADHKARDGEFEYVVYAVKDVADMLVHDRGGPFSFDEDSGWETRKKPDEQEILKIAFRLTQRVLHGFSHERFHETVINKYILFGEKPPEVERPKYDYSAAMARIQGRTGNFDDGAAQAQTKRIREDDNADLPASKRNKPEDATTSRPALTSSASELDSSRPVRRPQKIPQRGKEHSELKE